MCPYLQVVIGRRLVFRERVAKIGEVLVGLVKGAKEGRSALCHNQDLGWQEGEGEAQGKEAVREQGS